MKTFNAVLSGLAVIGICASIAVAVGCGSSSGACVGVGGIGQDECEPDWDESDCQRFENNQVNGATWTFYPDKSCADLGFTTRCSSGDKVYCR
jgi:hypothetical protein